MPTYLAMPQKEGQMQTSHRARHSLPLLVGCAAAILLTTSLCVTAAFAVDSDNFIKQALGKSARIGKLRGTVGHGYRVNRLRFDRHKRINSGPRATPPATSASLSFSATEASSFECKLDGASWASCTTPKAYSSLSLGSHQFSVRAKDAAGNVDATPATQGWTVEATPPPPPPADTTAPAPSDTSRPSATTTSTSASFGLSATEAGSSFECKLDSAGWAGCTTPKAYSGLTLRARPPSHCRPQAGGGGGEA